MEVFGESVGSHCLVDPMVNLVGITVSTHMLHNCNCSHNMYAMPTAKEDTYIHVIYTYVTIGSNNQTGCGGERQGCSEKEKCTRGILLCQMLSLVLGLCNIQLAHACSHSTLYSTHSCLPTIPSLMLAPQCLYSPTSM